MAKLVIEKQETSGYGSKGDEQVVFSADVPETILLKLVADIATTLNEHAKQTPASK